MLFWSGFRMRSQKMMEHMKENQNMFFVTTGLGIADVVGNHFPDSIQAVNLFGQAAKGHAVLKSDHERIRR